MLCYLALMRFASAAKNSFLLLLLAVAVYTATGLGRLLIYELQGPITWDSPLYFAVGRGILNGLVPYQDLYENKPPGMFLLSSLSWALFDDTTLCHLAQVLVIALFPAVLTYLAFVRTCGSPKRVRILFSMAGFLFGCLIAFYTAQRSGEFQTESFGAAFALLYIAAVGHQRQPISRKCIFAASIFLCAALGFKEPFFITIGAAALLMSTTWKQFTRIYLLPLLFAVLIGTVILLLLKCFYAYVDIYLINEVLRRSIMWPGSGRGNDVFVRGVFLIRLFRDMNHFAPILGYTIAALSVAFILCRTLERRRLWALQALRWLGVTAISLYLISFTVGLGRIYFNHHFIFAVPVYLALFIVVIEISHRHWNRYWSKAAFFVILALTLTALQQSPTHKYDYDARITKLHRKIGHARSVAQLVDRVLDNCGETRYFFLGRNGIHPYGYTTHSPLGPIFARYGSLVSKSRPRFRWSFLNNLNRAKIVVHTLKVVRPAKGPLKDFKKICQYLPSRQFHY